MTELRAILRREAPALALAVSCFAHSLVARAIPSPPPETAPEPTFVELMASPEPEPPRELPEVRPEPASESQPSSQPASADRKAPPPTPVPAAPPEPTEASAPAEPVALGVTLSGDDGSWSTEVGSGERITGPIQRSRGPETGDPTPSPRPRSRPAPKVVPLGDLSSRPVAPNLNGALRRSYPPSAREQEVSGQAAVRALIGPGGRVVAMRLVSESFPGFGTACRGALGQSRWSSPRDRDGRAVSTWVLYRCNFALSQ